MIITLSLVVQCAPAAVLSTEGFSLCGNGLGTVSGEAAGAKLVTGIVNTVVRVSVVTTLLPAVWITISVIVCVLSNTQPEVPG